MTSLTSLIERIEAATEGSRELDVAVIMALYPEAGPYAPYCKGEEPIFWNDPYRKLPCPRLTSSIDAALTLLPEGFKWKCGYSRHVPHNAEVIDYSAHTGAFIGESDASRCLALLAAILRARQTETRHDES